MWPGLESASLLGLAPVPVSSMTRPMRGIGRFDVHGAHQPFDVGNRRIFGVGEGEDDEVAVHACVGADGERENLDDDVRPGVGLGQGGVWKEGFSQVVTVPLPSLPRSS
jgi:hypothetical protein